MIKGKNVELRPARTRNGDPVQMGQGAVPIRAAHALGILLRLVEKVIQLRGSGHRRSAAVAGHHQGPAAVGPRRAHLVAFLSQPSAKKTREEGVPGSQHVKHFNPHPPKVGAFSRESGIAPSITVHPNSPRLITRVAAVTSRTARSVSMRTLLPPAISNSSSVPTTRSKRGKIPCKCLVTPSLET